MNHDLLFYTIGTQIMPSSRARIYVYEEILQRKNIKYKIIPAINNFFCKKRIEGKRNSKLIKQFFFFNALIRLLYFIFSIHAYNIVFVQKVLFPIKMIPLLKWLLRNKVTYFDIDDMIYRHHQGDNSTDESEKKLAEKYMQNMTLYDKIIVSTDYLKNDIILNFNFKDNLIHKIINPIDTVLFSSKKSQDNEIPVIGWIGTPTNTSYLEQCSDSINRLYSEGYSFRLFFTGAEENRVLQIFDPNIDISFENWSLPDEVLLYDRIDIGLMPLPDDNWSRTKAGYKLMLYMSMGKIGVASDVGINRDIIDHGKNAYLIKDKKEWYTIIKSILINYKNMDNLRKEARKTILDNYSKEIAGINFISQLLPGSGNK